MSLIIKPNRVLYSATLKKLPRHLRSVENFYFLTFAIPSLVCLLLVSPLLDYAGLWREAWSTLICAGIITALLALWRIGVSIPWLQSLYQATLMWTILYNAYYTGGVASPVMVWMGIVPILPLFTVSRRMSYVWLVLSFTFVATVYFAQIQGLIPLKSGISHKELTLSAVMIGLLCITQVMLVFTYDSANAQHIRNIERKNSTLKNLSQGLQKANEYKDKFLATVSHEMRTPLNALMGYLGLLRTTEKLPAEAASYIEGAQNSAAHLLTVINDLLDFSQIQQGKLVLSPQTVNIAKVLKDTHNTMAPKAASQALKFTLQLEDNIPEWIRTDPNRLTQIFLNLLGNALKFTQHGSVTTQVKFEPDPLDMHGGMIILIVHDTGIGIPSEYLQRVFEPFVQVPNQMHLSNDNALRGNGLGLSITKTLVVNLGGTIILDSQVGVGSTFEIHLPVKIARTPQISKATQVTEIYSEKIYLLIVDDHATNRLVTSATIKRDLPNAIIDEARNGTEAIDKMKNNAYDLVLMDLIMPDYSGIEVTRIIRKEGTPPLNQVHIVALTANVAENVIKDCDEVGISNILRKPFDRDLLISSILQYARAT